MQEKKHLKVSKFVIICLGILLPFLFFFGFLKSSIYSAYTINLQGKIVRNDTGYEGLNVSAGSPACVVAGSSNDTCDFRIRYYDASSGGTLLLTEEFSNIEIGQYKGVFNISLGSDPSPVAGSYSSLDALIAGEDDVYVEIGFAPAGNNSYTETFTRMSVQATAYAVRAKYADNASGASEVPWSGLKTPTGDLLIDHATNKTEFNWATGTGTDDLFTLKSDASATGTGALLNVQTGAGASLMSLRVRAGSTEGLMVDSQGRVGIGTTTPDYKLQVDGTIAPETTGQDLGTSALRWDIFAKTINASDTVTFSSLGAGSTNTVVTHSSGVLQTRTIDSRAWSGGGLVDGSGTTNYVAYWSDTDTLTGEQYLATSRGGTNSSATPTQGGVAYGTGTAYAFTNVGTPGKVLTSQGTGAPIWADPGAASSVALSSITLATGSNTINSGDHAQIWNWQLTTADKAAFTFGENIASTATGTSSILSASTLASSTAIPLYIKNLGTSSSFRVDDEAGDTTPFIIDNSGNVGIGTTLATEKLTLNGGNFIHTAAGNPTLKGTYNTSGDAFSVYVSGKYAYVADYLSGLQIIDISNPASPSLRGTYNTTGASMGVYISGKYAYVADGYYGLQVIDISNPALPSLAGTYDTDGSAYGIYVSGKYVYLGDNTAGLQIIDISNPSSPSLAGTYNTSGAAWGVYVSGKYAYVADGNAGLHIIDISNPSSPSLTGTYDTSGVALDVYVSGKYAYVADYGVGLQVIDISNPSSPSLIGTYNTTGNAYGIYVSGKYVYLGDESAGLHIIDISNPSSPSLTGTYNTSGAAKGVYVSGKYVYVADGSAGLQVLDISGIETPSLYAGNIQSNAITVTENLDIGNNLYVRNGLNVGPGGLYVNEGEVAFSSNSSSTAFSFRQKGTGDILNVFDNTTEIFTILDGGNVGIGTTSPSSPLSVGSNSQFTVNSTGNLTKVNNVAYSWPSSQGGSSTVLTNNGSGTLSWGAVPGDDWGSDTVQSDISLTGAGTTGSPLGFNYTATLANNPAMNEGEAIFGTTGLLFEGSTADTYETLLTVTDPTADRTITLPNATGTVALTSDIPSSDNYGGWRIQGDTGGPTSVTSNYLVDFEGSGGISTAFTANKLTIGTSGVLEDLNTLGAATAVDQFIVSTGAGVFAYKSAATARTSLGATTVGDNLFTLSNPSAITFLRVNADNSVSALSASDFRTAIGVGTGSGTVTSVGLDMPTQFNVTGSPVTNSGTLTASWNNQAANTILAGPTSGVAAVPTFRGLVNADIPSALTGKTYNGLSVTTGTNTFTLTRGSSTLARAGAHALTLTTTGITNATFPTGTYTLAKADSLHDAVTLSPSNRYLTLTGQQINVGLVNVSDTDHITGNLAYSNAAFADQNLLTSSAVTFAGITNNSTLATRMSSTASTATQIPVFIADPSGTTRTLVTRTPAQLRSDIGAGAGSGTVTSITAGTGLTATATNPITTSGTILFDYSNSLASNSLTANTTLFGSTGVLFEGSTADTYETLLTVTDPTADRTITLPNATGTVALQGDLYSNWVIKDASGDGGATVGSGEDVQLLGGSNITTTRGGRNITFATVNNPTFSTSITTPLIVGSSSLALRPSSNSTTGIQLQNAAGTNILNVDTTNSRVGIGTTSPTTKLHVEGNSLLLRNSANEQVAFTLDSGDTTTQSSYIFFRDSSATGSELRFSFEKTNTNAFQLYDHVNVAQRFIVGAGANSDITLKTIGTGKFNFINDTSTLVTILNSGKVGIGTASPGVMLDVVGDININTNGTNVLFSTYKGANSNGNNIFIGGGGQSSVGEVGSTHKGSNNAAMGYIALYSNTTGYDNSAMGYRALYSNTSGNSNTAMGNSALDSNTTGSNNSAIGNNALRSNTTASQNTAMGYYALYYNTTGYDNSAMGNKALFKNSTGYGNTAMGNSALDPNTTGYSNTAIGNQAGRYIANGSTENTTGYQNTFIGANTKASADNVYNETVIGYNAIGAGSNSITLGNDSVTNTILRGTASVGTLTASTRVNVISDGGNADYLAYAYGSGKNPVLLGRSANGSLASPTASKTDDVLLRVSGAGYGATGFPAGGKAMIDFTADEDWSDTNMGTRITFSVVQNTKTYTQERMTITNQGYVGIGTSSPSYQLQLSTNSAAKPSSSAWTVASDIRLKENIYNFTDGLNVLTQINPVNYTLNGQGGMPSGVQGIGVIAQDIQSIAPYTVSTFKAPLYGTETNLLSFDSSALTFVVINAIKEQQQMINSLEFNTNELLGKIENLEEQLNAINLEGGSMLSIESNLEPAINNTYDLGTNEKRWKDIYVRGTINIGTVTDSGGIKYDTETKELKFTNDGENWIALGSPTKSVLLSAQYPGGVVIEDEFNNEGTMTQGSTDVQSKSMNYYEWKSSGLPLNFKEIKIRYQIPSDFASWGSEGITFNYVTQTTNPSDNKIDFYVYDQSSTLPESISTDHVSSEADKWEEMKMLGLPFSQCSTPGDVCMFVIKMSSANDNSVKVGDISITYERNL